MKTMKKIVCALMTLVLLLSSVPAVFADEADIKTIAQDTACSLTVWKFDYTNAKKDGVWDEDAFPSTGWQESYVENALVNTNRKGDTDGQNGNVLGNGQTSKGYAIAGVEFTYLKVADITTFQNQETTQVLYGFHKTDAANLLKAIGLENGADRCAEADSLDADRCFYTSDTLNKALSQSLEANSTTVKNALETFIRNGGTAMDPTSEVGKTSAKNLPVGLYLLVETKVPEMVTSTTNPFFVSLPMTTVTGNDNSASQNGGTAWNYDVVVYPKQETGIPTLEKTVRESKADTGKNEGSASVTDGFAHTATGSAGDTMEYQIVSTLPTITSQATALSTYNFYDTLCEGLAYDKDGDSIRMAFPSGEAQDKPCRFVDETHLEVGNNLYHICEFAELAQRSGVRLIPLRQSLPEKCFSALESTGEIITITKGEKGYTPTGQYPQDGIPPKEAAAVLNDAAKVTREQEAAMVAGSMFGWDTPAADPKNYDTKGVPIKNHRERDAR